VELTPDLISDMVRALIGGIVSKNLTELGGGFNSGIDPVSKFNNAANFVRAGFALFHVMNNKAIAAEELLVGLQGLPEYPTFRDTYPAWNPDKNLWAKYRGEEEPDAPK
jgi:hypothetical protein